MLEVSFKIARQVLLLLGNYMHAYKIEHKMVPVEDAQVDLLTFKSTSKNQDTSSQEFSLQGKITSKKLRLSKWERKM